MMPPVMDPALAALLAGRGRTPSSRAARATGPGRDRAKVGRIIAAMIVGGGTLTFVVGLVAAIVALWTVAGSIVTIVTLLVGVIALGNLLGFNDASFLDSDDLA